jgi:sodium-dependent dicarboxylate transporter 2/3/5
MDIAGSLSLAVLFGTAYLLARAWMVTDAGHVAIARMARLAGKAADRVLLGYTLAVALLSLIIPSFVVAIAATPFVGPLVDGFQVRPASRRQLSTAFAAACMWAANVGGKGSIVGSTANAILLVYLQAEKVSGYESVTFLSWLLFGLPLSLLLALVIWLLLRVGFNRTFREATPDIAALSNTGASTSARAVYRLTLFFVLYWLADSLVQSMAGGAAAWPRAVAAILFGAFLSWALLRNGAAPGRPLLRPSDLSGGIPWRGFLLIAATGVVTYSLLKLFAIDQRAAAVAQMLVDRGVSGYLLLFAVLLLVIVATELASNTVVALTFFPIAQAVAPALGLVPLDFLILVSLASTAGYMTPMATPANALVVGEVRGIQLGRLVVLGLVLDVIVAAVLALWGVAVMPWLR